MDIGTMSHCALVSCTASQSVGLFFGCMLLWWRMPLCAPFTIFLIEFYFISIFIMIVVTIIWNFKVILFTWNYTFRLSVSKYFWFCKCATPCMFSPLDILKYRIVHVSFGLLCVMFTFPTRIFYRGVPGFATDCPGAVWCRGLTTCSCLLVHFLEI